jgi:predicted CxxxxCH...CXXCH cytochrome family protein
MKKIVLSFAALTIFSMVGMLFFNEGNLYSTSTGAPAGTCAASNCHNDGGAAQASPDVFLTVKDSTGTVVTQYKSGEKYTVTVGKHNTTAKVGFSLSTNIGILAKNTGDTKVQKMSAYLTHTFAGTSVTGGEAQWTGTWTAPATGTTAATLRLYINETNSSGSTDGDHIFTTTATLNHAISSGLNKLSSDIRFKVFPNPSSDQLFIAFDVKYPSPISISLTTIDGKETTALYNGDEPKGAVEKSFDISQLAKGIYLLNIQTTEGSATQKIFIN